MKATGFTLIELLMTLAVVAILLLVAAPSFSGLLRDQAVRSAAWELYQHINSARATAVFRSQIVSLSNGDGQWHTGAELFLDSNGNGEREETEELLRYLPAQKHLEISGNLWLTDAVSFYPDGAARAANGAFQMGTVHVCGRGSERGYTLVLSRGGRLRLQAEEGVCNAGE